VVSFWVLPTQNLTTKINGIFKEPIFKQELVREITIGKEHRQASKTKENDH
jgi:hypothetical protein